MSKLAEIHRKYQFDTPIERLHEPDPNCRKCKGEGEYVHPSRPGELTFCMCLFVPNQADRDVIAPMLAKAAKQVLKDFTGD